MKHSFVKRPELVMALPWNFTAPTMPTLQPTTADMRRCREFRDEDYHDQYWGKVTRQTFCNADCI